jgi:hypothetical protein
MNVLRPFRAVAVFAILASIAILGVASAYAGDTLNAGEMLKRGDYLTSDNQQYSLLFERDGNLILYAGKRVLWTTNTQGQGAEKCVMQRDGNFVLYLRNEQPVWATNTAGKPGSFLVLQNDGNLVVYQPTPVWASNTERGQRDERRGRWHGINDQRDRDRREDRGNR